MRFIGAEVARLVDEYAERGQMPSLDREMAGKMSPPKVGPGPFGQPQICLDYTTNAAPHEGR